MEKTVGLKLTSTFKTCKDCAQVKAKKMVNWLLSNQKPKGERSILDISSPSAVSMEGKMHWLLLFEDSTDYAWKFF